jgi:predicted flap endonuclease-1-like 5' DNA nuclease
MRAGAALSTALALLALVIAFGLGFLIGRRRRVSAPPTSTTPPFPTQADVTELQAERDRLSDELATARAEAARYRQLVIDIENNAPPPFFGPGAPDDLKLIVGVGPVLERMLQQLGVTTFRQIAHWSERDIDEFDARLHEFPGRIRRDGWVTQARELHQSKYGETLPPRGQ